MCSIHVWLVYVVNLVAQHARSITDLMLNAVALNAILDVFWLLIASLFRYVSSRVVLWALDLT